MNQFTLLVIILLIFTYYGGSYVPKVLKENKELLLGITGGLVLCSFLGMRLEGLTATQKQSCSEGEGGTDLQPRADRPRADPLSWIGVSPSEVCEDGLTCQDSGVRGRRGRTRGQSIYRCRATSSPQGGD